MRRGEIWTVSGGLNYAGKPRPAVIVQDDAFSPSDSATICSFTTRRTETDYFRPIIPANADNGLRETSRLMVDKVTTVPKTKLGARIGFLAEDDVLRLNQALILFLGLAVSPTSEKRAADGEPDRTR